MLIIDYESSGNLKHTIYNHFDSLWLCWRNSILRWKEIRSETQQRSANEIKSPILLIRQFACWFFYTINWDTYGCYAQISASLVPCYIWNLKYRTNKSLSCYKNKIKITILSIFVKLSKHTHIPYYQHRVSFCDLHASTKLLALKRTNRGIN